MRMKNIDEMFSTIPSQTRFVVKEKRVRVRERERRQKKERDQEGTLLSSSKIKKQHRYVFDRIVSFALTWI